MLRLIYPNGIVLEATDEAIYLLLLAEQQAQQVYTVSELTFRNCGDSSTPTKKPCPTRARAFRSSAPPR